MATLVRFPANDAANRPSVLPHRSDRKQPQMPCVVRIGLWLVMAFAFGVSCGVAARAAERTAVPTNGMQLWLAADNVPERDANDGVGMWTNQAPGTSHHAVQQDVARRPKWRDSVSSLGGQPALEFDGKDDFLHLPWLTIGSQTTVILVAENTEQTEGGSYWRAVISGDDDSFRDGATKYAFSFRRAGFDPVFIANLYYAPDKPHRLMQPNSLPTPVGFHIYNVYRRGTSSDGMTLRVDGVTVARLTADKNPPGFPGTGYTIGQGGDRAAGKLFRFYRGRIAEILIYDRPLAAIETLRVEEYLADKYGLKRPYAPPTRGLTLWLDAGSLPETDSGHAVVRLLDQSGRGHDAVQAVSDLQPTYSIRGINRRPALNFSQPNTQLDFSGWRPPANGTVFAAARAKPDRRAQITRELPVIDTDWSTDGARFSGLLSELLVYDRGLSNDETREVEQYLALRYSESPDPRCFDNGTLIFHNGYNDQPYVVKCRDGSWLCVMTTSKYAEHGADRTLVVTRSRNQGQTWSEPAYSIEPPDMRQPSWGTLYVTPYGRVYVFYNLRHDTARPSPIGFFFKYSDDHGETWSADRYPMPLRKIDLDTRSRGTGGWSVCPPIDVGSDVLVSYTRYANPGRSQGQGFVFRSENLQTERDPQKIRWEMLPAGDRGIRAEDVKSDMQEEHIITPLASGDLFCIWRSTSGYACQSYSRDSGRTWLDRDFAVYHPGGRRIEQPLACCRPYRMSDGRYLLWFHNTKPDSATAPYRPRDVVWIAGGEERAGTIHWSQPEVLMYGFDLPVRGLGMSYPDFIEEDGRLWVTTTNKEDARVFEIAPELLDGLWKQEDTRAVPDRGLLLDLGKTELEKHGTQTLAGLPSLLHGGFTIDLTFCFDSLAPGQLLLECNLKEDRGWSVTMAEHGSLRIELADGRHTPEGWTTPSGLFERGRSHHVTFIVDGGPNLLLAVIDGMLCDGGDEEQRGWGRFSRRIMDVGGENSVLKTSPQRSGTIDRLRLFDRPLRVSEAIAIYHNDRPSVSP